MKKKNIKNKKNNFSYLFIGFIIVCILLLSVGFASFSSKLSIDGKAYIDIKGIMRITNASVYDTSNGGYCNEISFTEDSVNVSTITPNSNSYVIYAIDVTNTSPYDAYLNAADPISFKLKNGSNSTVHSYEYLNLNGSTMIPKRSVYTFYVKVYYNGSGTVSSSNDTVNATFKLGYTLHTAFYYTINASPSDATVSVTYNGETHSEVGSYTLLVEDKSNLSWTVTKEDYYSKNGSYTMTAEDHTDNVTLDAMPKYTLRVIPNPNFAYVTITRNGKVIGEGNGTQTIQVVSGADISYTVIDLEYYDGSGNYTTTASAHDINVTLTEKPWITGTISNSDRTSAATKSDTNYHPGYYFVEVWGGRGGYGSGQNSGSSVAGSAGYVYGVVQLNYGDSIFATAGGNGQDKSASAAGGANGGGTSGNNTSQTSGSGGGYSAFAVGTSTINSNTISSSNVKLIAAGGGGAGGLGGLFGSYKGGNGGAGGTLSSTSTNVTGGIAYSGGDGTSATSNGNGIGYGGSSTAGGTKSGGSSGSLLAGGAGKERGGGGGAGYYGGGGGAGTRALSGGNYGPGGGGGGSSFVASGVSTTLPSGTSTSSNPSSTGGAVKITYIGKSI